MPDYILPAALIIISGFVFLQNRKPIEERPLAFDNPWAPLIYIPTGFIGVYLFLRMGIIETITGWFVSLFISSILYGIFKGS